MQITLNIDVLRHKEKYLQNLHEARVCCMALSSGITLYRLCLWFFADGYKDFPAGAAGDFAAAG
jgi:hypothetical protein